MVRAPVAQTVCVWEGGERREGRGGGRVDAANVKPDSTVRSSVMDRKIRFYVLLIDLLLYENFPVGYMGHFKISL